MMDISCTITPSAGYAELAQTAERLGYRRIWVNDSPALYPDVWMVLTRMAERTRRIGLGPAVLVPGLRHPLVSASAIASLEQMAPGRVAVVVGSGFTGRLAVGKKAHTWRELEDFIEILRTLLAGQQAQVDGAPVRMIHPDGYVAQRPLAIPILIAANGPKGQAVARARGDGLVVINTPQTGFDWCVAAINGTVLRDGEAPDSERAIEAAGPGVAVTYHTIYLTRGAEAVAALPDGERWAEAYGGLADDERRWALLEDHYAALTARDRPLVTGKAIATMSFTGAPEELRERLRGLQAAGATEVTFHPAGGVEAEPELAAFAKMAGLAEGVAHL